MTNDIKINQGTGVHQIEDSKRPAGDSRLYNLAGQAVSNSYHGVVIQAGKKHIIK